MPDLPAEINIVLNLMGLTDVWQVIDALPNPMGDIVIIQNQTGRTVEVLFLPSNLPYTNDDVAKISRIRNAIATATK